MTTINAETPATITTAKGLFEGTIREVCEWQSEMQGACAVIDAAGFSVDADGVCFDAEDLDDAAEEVIRLLDRASAERAAEHAEGIADAFREALGSALDSGVYFEVGLGDDLRVVVTLGDREERGYDAWQDVNFAVGEAAKAVGLEFRDSGPATPCDEEGHSLGGEYHQYDIR